MQTLPLASFTFFLISWTAAAATLHSSASAGSVPVKLLSWTNCNAQLRGQHQRSWRWKAAYTTCYFLPFFDCLSTFSQLHGLCSVERNNVGLGARQAYCDVVMQGWQKTQIVSAQLVPRTKNQNRRFPRVLTARRYRLGRVWEGVKCWKWRGCSG